MKRGMAIKGWGFGHGLIFLALAGLAAALFLTLCAPRPYERQLAAYTAYDPAEMRAAMAPAAVRAQLDAVTRLGDRFLGKPGLAAAAAHLRAHYTAAGLELYEQTIRTMAPVTEVAEARTEDGSLADFGIYPFMPNHYQPVATPDGGVTGEVLLVDDAVLRSRASFAGCLALIDGARPPPAGYGYAYSRYAQLGFAGVIVSHRDGLDAMPWSVVTGMTSVNPVNFPRIAADPGVFAYIGQTLTLEVRVRYAAVPNTTLVGVLAPGEARPEALIIPCSYDALSLLPDRSPGVLQAIPVAVQLSLLQGLLPHRDALRRDVILVAFGGRFNAQDAQDRLASVIGSQADRATRRADLARQRTEETARLEVLGQCRLLLAAMFAAPGPAARADLLAQAAPPVRETMHRELQYVLNANVLEQSEIVLASKIEMEKGDAADTRRPEFGAYQSARRAYDKAFSCAGLPWSTLLRDHAEHVRAIGLQGLLEARFDALLAHHATVARELDQGLALNARFAPYRRLIVLAPEGMPLDTGSREAGLQEAGLRDGSEELTFNMGRQIDHSNGGQPFRDAVLRAIQDLGLEDRVSLRFAGTRFHGEDMRAAMANVDPEAAVWASLGHPAVSLLHHGRAYAAFATPGTQPWMHNLESLSGALQVMGAMCLSVAYGNGDFKALPFSGGVARHYRGQVLAAGVGQSIIPNFPLAGALVGTKPAAMRAQIGSGYSGMLLMESDPYGRYARPYSVAPVADTPYDYNPEAVAFDATGRIAWIKDEGLRAQRTYKSMGLGPEALANDVNVICYRASPVTLLDLINPQSMKSYTRAEFLRRRGLSPLDSTYSVPYWSVATEGMLTAFIKPDEYIYVALKAGAADNERVQTTRAFLLGPEEPGASRAALQPGDEIRGAGYLAAETPLLRQVAADAAHSMIRVNAERLRVQDRYGMADEQTQDFEARSRSMLGAPAAEGPPSRREATLRARDAVTYATLVHPVLRRNIFEAVAGILWYLGLLVPFAFFFEKLVFGFSDIRKQISTHAVIFLVAFALLKILHPAFAMIRSSLMILLGFIILLISSGILAMFAGRFKENLEGIRSRRGQVRAAQINALGAVATAFMLGLNNMHRRRLRTMLTCATLVLITFVMICFTSVQSDIVDSVISVGRSPYAGFVVKNEQYRPVSEAELFALQTKYGDRYDVVARRILVGTENRFTRERLYPRLQAVRRQDGVAYAATPLSVVTLSPAEPLAARLPVTGRWFTPEEAAPQSEAPPILVSEAMAERLGIRRDAWAEAGAAITVELNGVRIPVCGVFSGPALDALLDLDGRNLLPFDIKALRDVNAENNAIIASEDAPRIAGDDVILAPRELPVPIADASARLLSVAVVLPPTLPPRESRQEIEQFMEQSGRLTYFGLDGHAFRGKRARERTLVGMLDMLIPLVIAAVTVLNTIRGSVYERKEEIFVYNAVGIAPRHIFFMFFAEAVVYAVVGSVLGYVLSQGTGRLLTALNLTGGLNMTFTSLGTIYASWAIAAAVFVSTWFPARTAMKIAAPSDDPGWRLPEADGDRLAFRLPFTFDWHDRIAVLAFFQRYLVDNGEGSAGPFYAGPPVLGVAAMTDPLDNGGYIPALHAPVWLRPFDLGVSQDLDITLPRDAETGEYVAEIVLTRRSGAAVNWARLNHAFVSLLRTHFLHWRAVPPESRREMFAEATAGVQANLGPGAASNGFHATPAAGA